MHNPIEERVIELTNQAWPLPAGQIKVGNRVTLIEMDIQAQKLELIEWLTQLTDERVLAKISALRREKTDWWGQISHEEKADIAQGLKDLEEGKSSPFDQVIAKYR